MAGAAIPLSSVVPDFVIGDPDGPRQKKQRLEKGNRPTSCGARPAPDRLAYQTVSTVKFGLQFELAGTPIVSRVSVVTTECQMKVGETLSWNVWLTGGVKQGRFTSVAIVEASAVRSIHARRRVHETPLCPIPSALRTLPTFWLLQTDALWGQ